MSFGMWNVRSLQRRRSLTTVVRELARCKLDLVGVQQVRWYKGRIIRAWRVEIFLMENEIKIINWEQDLLYTTG
jgi:hypothetical protein